MTELEQQLHAALVSLDHAVKQMAATKQPVDLLPHLRRIQVAALGASTRQLL